MATTTAMAAAAGRGAADDRPLDWLNFFLADVQGGVGPFLAIFLTSAHGWSAAEAGLALTVGGLATVAARGPCGALVDATPWKRTLIALAAVGVLAAVALMALWPSSWPVLAGQALNGVADAVFPAAVSAISLGIVGPAGFTRRVGRNEGFNHAGNVVTAIVAGLAGAYVAPGAALWLVAALALGSIAAVYMVRGADIDDAAARGGAEAEGPSGLRVIFASRPLLLFTAAVTLFHFANAAMLPLVGEQLAAGRAGAGSLFIAACVVAAQLVMVPMALLVGRRADRWGRRPLFLLAFAALPLRGVLYTVLDAPAALIAVQALDGIGAGIFGVLFPIVVADLTRGTGRFNLAQGASAACWGLGAALSNGVAGGIAARFGFDAAFLFLAACALAALALFWWGVPETARSAPRDAVT